MNSNENIIELDGVCYAYNGNIALRYITLNIKKGECVVLQGSNGSGKSTLLRLMSGLIYPEKGKYIFDGDEITEKHLADRVNSRRFHQRLGFIFQNSDTQLFCSSVEEEIAFGPLQMGFSSEEVNNRVESIIKLLDIEKLRKRAPYHLSGGEKRKVAIACILSMNPEVLMLDEPLAGLDRKSQKWLTEFLLALKLAGKTLIISTHNDELANKLADRIVEINDDHEIV